MGYARHYGRHHSTHLERTMEYLVLGRGGAPVVVFPTSRGRFYQWEDFSMVATLARHLENGWLQLFCLDSIDNDSWYNFDIEPCEQIRAHLAYDRYLSEEFWPLVRQTNPTPFVIATGASFGAFQAANFSFRHPHLVQRLVAMSGDYCIRKYLDDHYDLDVYYNCPVDFLPNLTDPDQLQALRSMDIILAAGDWDFCMGPTLRLGQILRELDVPARVEIWGERALHDWPLWKRMVLEFI